MPSINRIRVNNVKYNFGTQFYDNFTMKMYGKNTLYDLANGGGKSVLMLLLMQNMLPNSTLDDKQPIEKLFRAGNGNTTIHSLVEWKLDEGDDEEGYRYMTTGFCAKKAGNDDDMTLPGVSDEVKSSGDMASVEYFNYCIFYREFNKNDIVNLPLSKEGERISYKGLKNYLKDLSHRDMGIRVMIFERKGEYQRYISNYGIHESAWEIVRGINKTEGHVRTYFENNYKTTRKVVEDLLIEEIIEKAYLVKTEDDETDESMAKLLMDIKDKITTLTKKKKEIADYDRQIELIEVLADKVKSFMELYRDKDQLEYTLAQIYLAAEEGSKKDAEQIEELRRLVDEKKTLCRQAKKEVDELSVAKIISESKEVEILREQAFARKEELEETIETKTRELALKEAVNEYIDYLENRKQYFKYDALIKQSVNSASNDEEYIYQLAYNLKCRYDIENQDLKTTKSGLEDKLLKERLKFEHNEKMYQEAHEEYSINERLLADVNDDILSLSDILSKKTLSLGAISVVVSPNMLAEIDSRIKDLKVKLSEKNETLDKLIKEKRELGISLRIYEEKQKEAEKKLLEIEERKAVLDEHKDKLDSLSAIYDATGIDELIKSISGKIIDIIVRIESTKRELEKSDKRLAHLMDGRIIDANDSVKKVISYLETRLDITPYFGADYVSALDKETKEKILALNPEIATGIIVKEFEKVKDDPNLNSIETGNSSVAIYSLDAIEEKCVHATENIIILNRAASEILSESGVADLLKEEEDNNLELKRALESYQDIYQTYEDDKSFIQGLGGKDLDLLAKEIAEETEALAGLEQHIEYAGEAIYNIDRNIDSLEEEIKSIETEIDEAIIEKENVSEIAHITKEISDKEDKKRKLEAELSRIGSTFNEINFDKAEWDARRVDLESRINAATRKLYENKIEWNTNYKEYYILDKDYEPLTVSNDELKARFAAAINKGADAVKSIDDKRLLMDTLAKAMDKSEKSILAKGVDLSVLQVYERENNLFPTDDDTLRAFRKSLDSKKKKLKSLSEEITNFDKEKAKLDGAVDAKIATIESVYGEYVESSLVEAADTNLIISAINDKKELFEQYSSEEKKAYEDCNHFLKNQGYLLELAKDAARIIKTYEISTNSVEPLVIDDNVRELFDSTLMDFDKNVKRTMRAGNELEKFKQTTASYLDQIEAYELGKSVRDDVNIPESYDAAKKLLKNLGSIVDFINLEKERIEKSLVDMQTIKSNFEEQCLQRCLDVRTELDKLPKLSRITVEGETINMISLSIPYVKQEFLRNRMSEYIDGVVKTADTMTSDKEKIKHIRNSLALKKLFSVIVTDMNKIKLELYKRERIKEQSRYLRYEEAVGSTGQSQGIYIQFLVSIINYISGMYKSDEEKVSSKTIFIDNPFGAAKDIYIWEPIFALLKANNVQLVVPARGVTPAITGCFDINYILGQQYSEGKQLTVVTDFQSRADQDELEYKELEYEQMTFDFI